jgi:fungal STAND N-terminal Goodbye domain
MNRHLSLFSSSHFHDWITFFRHRTLRRERVASYPIEDMATEFDQLWEDALSTFSATTDSKLDDISLPLLTTLDDLKLELNKRHESFSEFRKKRQHIVGRADHTAHGSRLFVSY